MSSPSSKVWRVRPPAYLRDNTRLTREHRAGFRSIHFVNERLRQVNLKRFTPFIDRGKTAFNMFRSWLMKRPSLFHWHSRWVHGGTETTISQKAKRGYWLSPTLLVVGSIPVLTFALGTWQLQRLQWKVDLIHDLEEKMQQKPVSLPNRVKSVRFASSC
jgi:hypothetical protein